MNAAARRARRKEQAALRRAKVAKDRQRTRATAIQTNEKSPDESRSFFKSKPSPSTRDLQEALGPPAQLRGQLSQGNKSAQRALMGEMQNRNQGNMPSRLGREGSVREAALAREAELFGGRNPNRRNPQADVPQQRPPVRGASRRTQGREPSRRHLMQTQGPESLGARGQRDLPDHARRALESGRAGVPQDARRLTNEQRAGLSAQRDRLAEGEREKQRVESIRKANPGMVAREKEFQARGEALNADIGRQTQGMSPQDRDSFLKTYQPLKDMQADSARFSAEREKLFFGRDAGSAPRRQPSFKTSAGRTPDETRSFFKTQPAPRVDERPDTGYGAPPPASVAQPQTNVTRPQPPTNVTPRRQLPANVTPRPQPPTNVTRPQPPTNVTPRRQLPANVNSPAPTTDQCNPAPTPTNVTPASATSQCNSLAPTIPDQCNPAPTTNQCNPSHQPM